MTTNTNTKAVRVPLYKGVSCVTYVQNPDPYGEMHINYFDVPSENYTDGNLTGIKLAFEVMAAARNGDFDSFQSVHAAASKVLRESENNDSFAQDGAGAAVSYLETISQVLMLAAKSLDLTELMVQSLDDHEDMLQDGLNDTKVENAAFLERMRAGNAAKTGGRS